MWTSFGDNLNYQDIVITRTYWLPGQSDNQDTPQVKYKQYFLKLVMYYRV